MVIASWLEETLEKRRQQQIKAATEKAAHEGRTQGITEERQRWQDWNRRREAAADAGEEFTEPPPASIAMDSQDPQR